MYHLLTLALVGGTEEFCILSNHSTAWSEVPQIVRVALILVHPQFDNVKMTI